MDNHRHVIAAATLVALVWWGGCASYSEANGRGLVGIGAARTVSAYGMTVTSKSSPMQVAELFVAGLDRRDENLVRQLIAAKAEEKKLADIMGRRARVSAKDAMDVAAAGWIASYSYFEPNVSRVVSQSIHGNEATVEVTGVYGSAREPRTIEIHMVREDGLWRVVGGPRTKTEKK